jgi:hypothetical protein
MILNKGTVTIGDQMGIIVSHEREEKKFFPVIPDQN